MPDDIQPRSYIYKTLKSYLETLTDQPIRAASHLELDLGLDSLDYVQLFVFTEECFDVAIDEEVFADIMVFEKYVAHVENNARQNIPDIRPSWNEILKKEVDYKLRYSPVTLTLFKTLFLPIFKLYFRISVKDCEHIDRQPCIIAPTHQSMIDGFLLASVLPYSVLKETFFLAFEVVFGSWWMRPVANNGQMVLIDSNKNLIRSMLRSARVLTERKNLVVFPEGARTRNRQLLEFKPFFAILAKELNVPIVPVVLDGSYEALPAGRLFPRPAKVEIRFLPPVSPDGKSYEEITQEVKTMLQQDMDRHPLH